MRDLIDWLIDWHVHFLLLMGLARKKNLFTVYIHQKEDKMWIAVGTIPQTIAAVQLGIHNKTDVISLEFNINEKVTYYLNQPNGRCRNYENGRAGFNACSQNYIASYMNKTINCTIPGLYPRTSGRSIHLEFF